MMNLKDFAINMDEVAINFNQLKNAAMVAVKAALSSAVIIADQVLLQSNAKQLHIDSDGIELIVNENNAMVITKEFTIISDVDTLASMEYDLEFYNMHQLTELLNSLVRIGQKFQKGSVEVDTEFTSKGMDLYNAFLSLFDSVSLKKHVNYKSHDIVIDNDSITMDGKVLLQGKIFYYYEWATRVLIDLMGVISVKEENKYDVLFGGKPFSNEGDDNIKEWPCKHA